MTRLTIELDEEVAKRVADEAAVRGMTPEALVAEVIADAFPARQLSIIGIGASGGGESVAEHHKKIRREHFADKTATDT